MKNRMMMLFAFLAAFVLSAPVLAAPPTEAAPAADTDAAPAVAADTDAAPEAKAEEPKADEKKAEAKTDEGEKPAVITTDEEAMSAVSMLIDAAKNGHWSLVIALSIMLLIYVGNRTGLLKKLPNKALPWVAAGIGMGGYIAAALMVEGTSMMDAVTGGVVVGAAAVGLWEMVFKHFLASKKAEADTSDGDAVAGDAES